MKIHKKIILLLLVGLFSNFKIDNSLALSNDKKRILITEIQNCWNPPVSITPNIVDITVDFDQNGELLDIWYDSILYTKDENFRYSVNAVERALNQCGSYSRVLKEEHYEKWKTLSFRFDPSFLGGSPQNQNHLIRGYSLKQICELSFNKVFSNEAKRRGLTCGINDSITTQVASFSLDYYTDLQICEASTTKNKQMIKIWNNALNFVQEAKRRGLNCDVSESSSTLVASSTNISNQIPLITNIRAQTFDKQGIVTGSVKDNASIAEVTVDGNVVTVSSNGSFEYTTYVPATGLSIKVQVTDLAGLSSSQTVTLERNVNLATASLSFDRLNPIAKPAKRNNNALALIIGVSDYENTPAKAIYADSDAMVFRDYASEKLGIPDNRIKTLVNDGADKRELLVSINNCLSRSVKQGQTDVYVFFAGHGLASDDGQNMYLLPYDGSPEFLDDTAFLRDRIFSDIASANPRSVTVFLDTCYSGSTRGSEMLIADARPILLKAKDTSVPEGFTVFTAAAGDETAKSLQEAKHGLFSYFLMKGMEGDADTNGDKQITAGELHAYVKSNVIQQSSGTQTPELQGDTDRVLVQFK